MRSLHRTENAEEHARYVPQAPFFPLSFEDIECLLGGAGIGMLAAMAFRTIELYLR